MRCMTFHHINPENKSFPLTISNLWSRKWPLILKEVEKCDLLCYNCHMSLEQDIANQKSKIFEILRKRFF